MSRSLVSNNMSEVAPMVTETECMPLDKSYVNVYVPISYRDARHVVGRNGRHLHRLREESGVDNVWYNKQRALLHFWGKRELLEHAALIGVQHVNDTIASYRLKVRTRPKVTDINISFDLQEIAREDLGRFIGRNGRHFKQITANSGASYLWYDDNAHVVQVWGSPECAGHAANLLKERVHKLLSSANKNVE